MKKILLSILFIVLGLSIGIFLGYLLLIIPEIGAMISIAVIGGIFFSIIVVLVELFIGKG